MNWREVLWLIVIGGLIAACSFLGIKSCNQNKEIVKKDSLLIACRNSPRDTVFIHDSSTVYDTLWRTPKKVIVFIHDSTPAKYCDEYYADHYDVIKNKDTGVIYYAIHSKDCGAEIKFPKVVLPKEKIIITQHIDTCIEKPPAYKAKFLHHGPYVDMTLNNFKSFPGLGIGYQLIFKDQVTLSVGGTYLEKPYFNIRLGILFKK